MISKTVFITQSTFNKRDYHRFGVDILINRGIDVEVWDLTPFLRPEYFQNYTPPDPVDFDKYFLIDEKNHVEDLISELSDRDIVFCITGTDEKNMVLYHHLSKNSIKYGFVILGVLPKRKSSFLYKTERLLKNPSLVKRKIFKRNRNDAARIEPAHVCIVGGLGAIHAGRHLIGERTNIIKTHAFDYDRYLEAEHDDRIECNHPEGYAVFLDEYTPYHPEQVLSNREVGPDCIAEEYYPPLNDFFNYIEEKLGLKLIIAAHPRAHYNALNNPFGGRKFVFGKTAGLVKYSKLVLAHCSTSLNFAILYKKPVMFLLDSTYSRWYTGWIKTMASSFGEKPIILSKTKTFRNKVDGRLLINSHLYDHYMEMYIKESGTPEKPIWEIFADYCHS